jgi:hypothetical protein
MLLVTADTRALAADRDSYLAHVIILLACPAFPSAQGRTPATTGASGAARLPVGACENGGRRFCNQRAPRRCCTASRWSRAKP